MIGEINYFGTSFDSKGYYHFTFDVNGDLYKYHHAPPFSLLTDIDGKFNASSQKRVVSGVCAICRGMSNIWTNAIILRHEKMHHM